MTNVEFRLYYETSLLPDRWECRLPPTGVHVYGSSEEKAMRAASEAVMFLCDTFSNIGGVPEIIRYLDHEGVAYTTPEERICDVQEARTYYWQDGDAMVLRVRHDGYADAPLFDGSE